MSYVTAATFDASRDSGLHDPSWSDLESLFHALEEEKTGMLALAGANEDVRLVLSVAKSGRMSVSWYSERTGESWVVESEADEGATEADCLSAECPARGFVDRAVALRAVRTFFEDGTRDPRLSWTSDEAIAF